MARVVIPQINLVLYVWHVRAAGGRVMDLMITVGLLVLVYQESIHCSYFLVLIVELDKYGKLHCHEL